MARRPSYLKVLFLIIAAIAAFQLLGIEEAFCDDCATEILPCQDCFACPSHQVIILSEPFSMAGLSETARILFSDRPFYDQDPALSFLRPPILL